jgi:hypothetical protein
MIPAAIQGQKYISLTTFRKNGAAVATPVWFGEGDGKLYRKGAVKRPPFRAGDIRRILRSKTDFACIR